MPLVVNHQGVLPAVTITYNIAPGSSLDAATTAIEAPIAELNPPSSLHAGFRRRRRRISAKSRAAWRR